jgi:hypothetical protein
MPVRPAQGVDGRPSIRAQPSQLACCHARCFDFDMTGTREFTYARLNHANIQDALRVHLTSPFSAASHSAA